MSKPVQIKIFFGLLLISKRMVLIMLALEIIIFIAVVIASQTILSATSDFGRFITHELPWFYDALPWALGVVFVLDAVGSIFMLRKLRQREEFLQRESLHVPAEG